ncbi:medium-chain dehydrogenase/reductase like protein [Neolentinus lepideus HHB14362 ss-1]|uniref:Medium-chain dehydrogenase/reductase like protein n=1 Tax=Neolentinus lepideus HHB14362 ss-1 TaxID=1314782 RepID=A0A165ULC3_9AGAM|nr:medium-chain dehydrogenase/reductase like protein [Neolentinus lepideus HHB14362 ss-1]
MSLQKALFLQEKFGSFAVGAKDVPTPGAGELLVRIEATALNPVDWKIQKYGRWIEKYPAILGCEVAGTVEYVGEGVTGFSKGDRVVCEGWLTSDRASFQQYAITDAEVTGKIPPHISFEQAASISGGIATAGLGLYADVDPAGRGGAGLFPPWEVGGRNKYAGKPILVLGGASSVGQYVIQLARLSGFFPIISTASLHNEDLLKSLGATHVIDRKLPFEGFQVALTSLLTSPLEIVYDAISVPDTQQAGYDLLAPGGTLAVTLAITAKIDLQANKRVFQVFGNVYEPTTRKISVDLFGSLEGLLATGDIKPNPVRVLPDGLLGIPGGLKELEENKVSGVKLIARPQDTPQ